MYTVNIRPEETLGILFEVPIGENVEIKVVGVSAQEVVLSCPKSKSTRIELESDVFSVPEFIMASFGYVMVTIGTSRFGFRITDKKDEKTIHACEISATAPDGSRSDVQTQLGTLDAKIGAVTPEAIGAATKEQGEKAESALQAEDIANNLTTQAPGKPLDAVQGAVLKAAVDGKASYTLLYQNASPTSAFPSQTIAINLKNYDLVEVQYYICASIWGYQQTIRLSKNAQGLMIGHIPEGQQSSRMFYSDDNGVWFGSAGTRAYNSATNVHNDLYMVPFKIRGIKGAS